MSYIVMAEVNRLSLDAMLELLAHKRRRHLLFALLDTPPEGTVDISGGVLTRGETAPSELELRHRHLPKLADAGVVDWDPDRNEVSRGPAFDAVVPVLQSLSGVGANPERK